MGSIQACTFTRTLAGYPTIHGLGCCYYSSGVLTYPFGVASDCQIYDYGLGGISNVLRGNGGYLSEDQCNTLLVGVEKTSGDYDSSQLATSYGLASVLGLPCPAGTTTSGSQQKGPTSILTTATPSQTFTSSTQTFSSSSPPAVQSSSSIVSQTSNAPTPSSTATFVIHKSHVGAIAGGAVGGTIVLLALGVLLLYLSGKKKRRPPIDVTPLSTLTSTTPSSSSNPFSLVPPPLLNDNPDAPLMFSGNVEEDGYRFEGNPNELRNRTDGSLLNHGLGFPDGTASEYREDGILREERNLDQYQSQYQGEGDGNSLWSSHR